MQHIQREQEERQREEMLENNRALEQKEYEVQKDMQEAIENTRKFDDDDPNIEVLKAN